MPALQSRCPNSSEILRTQTVFSKSSLYALCSLYFDYVPVPQKFRDGSSLLSPSNWTQAHANLQLICQEIDKLQLLLVGTPSQALELLRYRSDHKLSDQTEETLRKALVLTDASEKQLLAAPGFLQDWRKWYERRRDEAAAQAARDDPKRYHLEPANRIATAFKSLKHVLDTNVEALAQQETSKSYQQLVQVRDDYASAMLGTVVPSHVDPESHAAAAGYYRKLVRALADQDRIRS
jgi:hypothetical protein